MVRCKLQRAENGSLQVENGSLQIEPFPYLQKCLYIFVYGVNQESKQIP